MTEEESPETSLQHLGINVQEALTRPRLIAVLFSDWATIDRHGKVALGGVFDKIDLPAEGDVFPNFYVFIKLTQAHEKELRVTVYTPDGSWAGEIQLERPPGAVAGSTEELEYVQVLAPIRFTHKGAGIYWFDVSYGDTSLATIPLDVRPPEKTDGMANR